MPQSAVQRKVVQAGAGLEEVARSAPYLKSSVSEVMGDGLHKARRAVKKSRYAAQDLIDDVLYSVRRHSLRSVAVTAGVAFGLGVLVGRKL
jgi:ElaB/YqjD/DUF883 family membrane-anchored ribosome-binding protein